ncbi:MAG: type I methionyl aminopeptidase [Rhodospirillaceae bacterium]|nr:type I methionyl aminopeptidase [Rhodospirillaceae bacterium]
MSSDSEDKYITIHSSSDFKAMHLAGHLAASCLDYITPFVIPGVTTEKLDRLCADFIFDHGGISACLNHLGYPKSICTSVNHVVCHGIPGNKILEEGDIINIDVTPILDGWHGDSSRMYYVGKVGVKARKLCEVTYESMMLAIKIVKPGITLGDIGHTIQEFVEKKRFSVVRDFCGHGTGRVFHEPPNVVHYGQPGQGMVLREGMIFTIEPMVNSGRCETKTLADGWTVVTKDHNLSAQFEHTIGVTSDGYEIFTASPAGLHCPI